MLRAFTTGLRAVVRNPLLVLLVLGANAGLAALLAMPLENTLAKALHEREAAERQRDGFDYAFWDHWHDAQEGFTKGLTPELAGAGFAYRNLDLLLRGQLPAGLFDHGEKGGADALDPLVAGLGVLYLLLQTFLTGGVLSVLRRPAGGFKLRACLHAAGFYFGRLFRLALLTLALYGIVFALNAPLARWADFQGRDAVSETGALAWAFGRRLVLLVALGVVFVLSSYAKAIIVLEERASALLALASATGFVARRAAAVAGHALLVLLCGLAALALWRAADGAWPTTGYKSQLVALALMQLFMCARIGLRLAYLGGALALYRDEHVPA